MKCSYCPNLLRRLRPFDLSCFPLPENVVSLCLALGISMGRGRRRCFRRPRRRWRGFYKRESASMKGESWGHLPGIWKYVKNISGPRFLISIELKALGMSPSLTRLDNGDKVTWAVLFNARSISNKTSVIYDLLDNGLDLACITETWLDECAAPILAAAIPQGFSVIHCPRLHRRGGGVAIYFRSNLQCTRILWKDTSSFEHVIATCEAGVNLRILLIYRPPWWNAEFLNEFSELISWLVLESSNLIVLGDFNTRFNDSSDTLAVELLRLMQAFGFSQSVSSATHESGHMLDLISSKGISISDCLVSPIAWSDHSLVHFDLGVAPPSQKILRTYSFRPRHLLDPDTFREMFSSSESLFSKCKGVDLLVDSYNSILSTNIDLLAPLHTWQECPSRKPPWFNSDLKRMKASGRRLEHRWRVSGLLEDRSRFRLWLSSYQKSIRNTKSAFFASLIDSEKYRPTALFRVVDQLLNPSCLHPSDTCGSQSCDSFLDYFSKKVDLIRSDISSNHCIIGDKNISRDLSNHAILWNRFSSVSNASIEQVLCGLRPTTCIFDPCPSWLIRVLEGLGPPFLQDCQCLFGGGFLTCCPEKGSSVPSSETGFSRSWRFGELYTYL
ncbi:uncharacterized protein LOC135359563 [Latimeria chalumnae]|uniref:uncharacterized protein LOC135359563 n=1 Tax=Latimeria chalumnae TaxID=7897 RepID=UPI00313F316C